MPDCIKSIDINRETCYDVDIGPRGSDPDDHVMLIYDPTLTWAQHNATRDDTLSLWSSIWAYGVIGNTLALHAGIRGSSPRRSTQ